MSEGKYAHVDPFEWKEMINEYRMMLLEPLSRALHDLATEDKDNGEEMDSFHAGIMVGLTRALSEITFGDSKKEHMDFILRSLYSEEEKTDEEA